jgi:hypothetical protein
VNVPVTATWDSTNQRVALTIPPAFNNLLSNNAANMEGTSPAGAWGDSTNNDVTAPITNINSITFSTPTVTVNTSTAHGLTIGNKITIANTTAGGNQGTFYVATVPTTTQFTVTNSSGAAQAAITVTTAALVSGSTWRYTTSAVHGFTAGQTVTITGMANAGNNGSFVITNVAATNTFDVTNASGVAATSQSGAASVATVTKFAYPQYVSNPTASAGIPVPQAYQDTQSLAIRATAAGNLQSFTTDIAVTAGASYLCTAFTRSTVNTRTARLCLAWKNASGTLISNAQGTATTTSVSAWTPISSGLLTAPTGAVSATPFILVESATTTSGEIHFFDRYMVTPIDSSITVRTNLCTNPSFETNNGNWTPASATITQDTTRYLTGTAAGLIGWSNAVAVDGATVYNTLTGLSIGQQYTLSFYAYTPTGGPDIGAYVATIIGGTTSTTKDAWVRVSYTFTATATSHQIGIRNKSITGTSTSTWIDAVLIEQSSTVNDYFDGNVTSPYYGGFLGAANASASQTYFGWLTGGYTLPSITVQRTDSIVTTQAVRAYRSLTATTSTLQYFTLGHTKETYYDYEAARGTTVSYRSQMLVVSGTGVLATAWSTTDTFNPAISITSTSDGKNWLKVIDSPTLSRSVSMADKPTFALDEEVAMFKPRGRGYSLAISGGLYGTGGTLELISTTASDWATLKLVVEFKGTLLWQDAFGRQRWIRLTKRSYDQQGPVGREIRFVKCDYVEVGPN